MALASPLTASGKRLIWLRFLPCSEFLSQAAVPELRSQEIIIACEPISELGVSRSGWFCSIVFPQTTESPISSPPRYLSKLQSPEPNSKLACMAFFNAFPCYSNVAANTGEHGKKWGLSQEVLGCDAHFPCSPSVCSWDVHWHPRWLWKLAFLVALILGGVCLFDSSPPPPPKLAAILQTARKAFKTLRFGPGLCWSQGPFSAL